MSQSWPSTQMKLQPDTAMPDRQTEKISDSPRPSQSINEHANTAMSDEQAEKLTDNLRPSQSINENANTAMSDEQAEKLTDNLRPSQISNQNAKTAKSNKQEKKSSDSPRPNEIINEQANSETKLAENEPLLYGNYKPVSSKLTDLNDLPVHFWFYVFLNTTDASRLMMPLLNMNQRFGGDRRLQAIMNRSGVRISLGSLELYKSLPRRVVIMRGRCWDGIVRAILEMEELLPELMRFASYPILMDTPTRLFNSTFYDQTATIVRLSRPLMNR